MVNANETWTKLTSDLLNLGQNVAPRGRPTKEILAYRTHVSMNYPIVTIPERRLGYKFQAAEAAWILSGDNRVETIAPYSKEISQFSDDGVTFFGAYGPKILSQIYHVVKSLVDDPISRQAFINIWRENPPLTKDVPCTVSLQFLIRENMLHCVATMRSSDAWLGWPYDVFNFSMVAGYVAIMLKDYNQYVKLGSLILTAGSQHLYEKHWDPIHNFLKNGTREWDWPKYNPFSVDRFEHPDQLVNLLWEMAQSSGTLDHFKKRI